MIRDREGYSMRKIQDKREMNYTIKDTVDQDCHVSVITVIKRHRGNIRVFLNYQLYKSNNITIGKFQQHLSSTSFYNLA